MVILKPNDRRDIQCPNCHQWVDIKKYDAENGFHKSAKCLERRKFGGKVLPYTPSKKIWY